MALNIVVASICKNEEDMIRPWIEHLLALDCITKIIIVDTGSTDNTIPYIKSYVDSRVQLIEKPWTGDFSEARNTALSHTNGADWILQLDIDELFTEGYENLFEMIGYLDLSSTDIVRFPHIKFYDFDTLWFNKPPTLPCYEDGVVKYSIYKDTIALFRPQSIVKYTGKLHERLGIHGYPTEKLMSLNRKAYVNLEDIENDIVVGHYSKAKIHAQARRTNESFEFCVGKKRIEYRKISTFTYGSGRTYGPEWAATADKEAITQLGRDQLDQFIVHEGHVFPEVPFKVMDINNEYIRKYFGEKQ